MEQAKALAEHQAEVEPPGFPDAALCSMYVSLAVFRVAESEQHWSREELETSLSDLRRAVNMKATGSHADSIASCSRQAQQYLQTLEQVRCNGSCGFVVVFFHSHMCCL